MAGKLFRHPLCDQPPVPSGRKRLLTYAEELPILPEHALTDVSELCALAGKLHQDVAVFSKGCWQSWTNPLLGCEVCRLSTQRVGVALVGQGRKKIHRRLANRLCYGFCQVGSVLRSFFRCGESHKLVCCAPERPRRGK